MVNVNECVATARQVDPFIWSQYAILHLKLEIAQRKYKSEDTAQAKTTTFAHLFVQVQFSAQVLLLLLYCLLQFSSSLVFGEGQVKAIYGYSAKKTEDKSMHSPYHNFIHRSQSAELEVHNPEVSISVILPWHYLNLK